MVSSRWQSLRWVGLVLVISSGVALCLVVGGAEAFVGPSGYAASPRPQSGGAAWEANARRGRAGWVRLSMSEARQSVVREEDDSGEWHPRDPADSVPQLLSTLWFLITKGCQMKKGESYTVMFPMLEQEFSPSFMNRLMGHLDVCKDVCDEFGTSVILLPYTRGNKAAVVGFTVKSFKDPAPASDALRDDGGYNFQPDPMWDNVADDEFDYIQETVAAFSSQDGDYAGGEFTSEQESTLPPVPTAVPDDDDEIIDTTKEWVRRMMSDMGVCPFTSGAEMAGLPMGQVFYTVDRCASMEEMYHRYWKEVVRVEKNNEKDVSTILLIAPNFCANNVELFDSFTSTLTHPLDSLKVEDLIQLVFFHSKWTFRDGSARVDDASGTSAANYARRSPWPMINILRTNQVRAAQRGIPTGLVYQQNEKTLAKVGSTQLEAMLRSRDWHDLEGHVVDRRDREALRVAQDLQTSGGVSKLEDTSLEHDATPAANKVNRDSIERGDLVKVISQALEKRLFGSQGDAGPLPLNGAETSATMMASDFLIGHLDQLSKAPPIEPAMGAAPSSKKTAAYAAYFDLDDDLEGYSSSESSDQETSVLFGGQGIMEANPGSGVEGPASGDVANYAAGLNPNNFF